MSRNYEDITARFWNIATKGEEEAVRERDYMDDIIQKAHLDREIDRYLDGVTTVFDGGAGAGRFTLPSAARGLKVTHFDVSRPMLDKARELAAAAGAAENIEFVEGRLTDLSRYADNQFDLVISFDAPVSYCYPNHAEVLRELLRIAGKAVIVSVSSRVGYFPYFFNPAQKLQYIVDPDSSDPVVQWYVQHSAPTVSEWQPDFAFTERFARTGLTTDPDAIYTAFAEGKSPWPPNYCFMPDELEGILSGAGLRDIRLSGPGALSRSIPAELLRRLLLTSEYRERFLDQCYSFDSQRWVCGLGKDNLVASGRKG